MSRIIGIIVAFFLILYLPSETINAAEDAYYTWVDESGVTNFAQQDSKEFESTYVSKTQRFGPIRRPRPRTPSPEATPPSGQQEVDPEIDIQNERADIEEQIARIRASNCEIGKRNLAKLEVYARIRVQGDDGEERVISEEEKQALTTKARNTITENCVSS
ncbi:MAG: hypothetical protein QGD92_12090 [Gammaproteobacteria bacterium]|nr:hypothetical protein [Gammaproteobacteria bacterium]